MKKDEIISQLRKELKETQEVLKLYMEIVEEQGEKAEKSDEGK